MTEPSVDHPVSLSTSGYKDGLGRRTLTFDRESGAMLERLHLRPELGAFEKALQERTDRLSSFKDERLAPVRAVERDHTSGALTIVSEFASGNRLSDLLDGSASQAREESATPGVDVALGLLLEVLPALGALHSSTGLSHGAIGPGRIIVTPAGHIVLLDASFAQALERLHFSRQRLWTEFGLAMAPAAGLSRFDVSADIGQAALIGVMLTLGRTLREDEYPGGLAAALAEVIEIAQIRGSQTFADGLRQFFQRTLPLPGRRPYSSADEAARDLGQVARALGIGRCRIALTAFVRDMNAVLERVPVEQPAPEPEFATALWEPIALRLEAPVAETFDTEALAVVEPLMEIEAPGVLDPPTEVAVVEIEAHLPALDLPVQAEAIAIAEPEPAYKPEPVAIAESEPPYVPDPAAVADAEPACESEPVAIAEPEPAYKPEPVAVLEPEPAYEPAPVAIAEPESAFEPEPAAIAQSAYEPEPHRVAAASAPQAPPSRRRKRGSKGKRDKLRSNAAPAPMPVPVTPMPVPVTLTPMPAPVMPPAPPPAPACVRLKVLEPAGYNPPAAARTSHRHHGDARDITTRGPEKTVWAFAWKLAAAAVVLIVTGVGAGRAYLPERHAAVTPAAGAAPAARAVAAKETGSLEVASVPTGVKVLLDGNPVGETPLTVDGVTVGKHALTFITSSGTVRKVVKIEAGQSLAVDVPVYAGWVAVFAPIPLDIAEKGRAIGTTEQGRIMLAPGRHSLTLSNQQLGYRTERTVDIEPGEERAVTVQPTGTLSINALPWAEVWIDGQKAGETPLAHFQVPLGTREVVFKHPQFGERRMTAVVTASQPVALSVDFNKPPQF